MIESGKYYVVFKKPDFFSENALAYSDLNGLVEAQVLHKKFNDGIAANVTNLGGTTIDAGSYMVLDMPINSLNSLLNIQNSMQTYVPFGVGSTLDGAYKALQVAQKYQKRLELYIPDQTERMLSKSEEQKQSDTSDQKIPDEIMPQASPEEVNDYLLAEIQAKSQQVDPQQFYGLISEFQQILQNFKLNLPTIEMMQLTNPTAYSSILDVVNAASQFAQILMMSGVLNTDLGMMMEQQQMQEQAAQQEEQGGDGGGESEGSEDESDSDGPPAQKSEEPSKKKASKENPVGTVKPSGTTFRVKTPEGWKYASRGLGQSAGGFATPGTGAGTNTEGVEAPEGPRFTDEQE